MKRRRPLTRQDLIERLAPGLRPMLNRQQLVTSAGASRRDTG